MRHRVKMCVVMRYWKRLATRRWHCCECGWPMKPCVMMHPDMRHVTVVASASSPRCGDSAGPYVRTTTVSWI